jgi:hypothetical protein
MEADEQRRIESLDDIKAFLPQTPSGELVVAYTRGEDGQAALTVHQRTAGNRISEWLGHHWRKVGWIGGLVLIGAAASVRVMLGQPWLSVVLEAATEVGMALIIGICAARTFEFLHRREMIGIPLSKLGDEVGRLGREAKEANDDARRLANTVSQMNDVMAFALDHKILSCLLPGEQNWQSAVTEQIKQAKEFVFIQGRTLGPFLVERADNADAGWLGRALDEKVAEMKTQPLEIAILVANVFDETTGYTLESKVMLSSADDWARERENGRDAVKWVLERVRRSDYSTNGPHFSLRLVHGIPPVFGVLTESCAIVGQYVRFHKIDGTWMQQIAKESRFYQPYLNQFSALFAAAGSDLKEVLDHWMEVERPSGSTRDEWRDLGQTANQGCMSPRMQDRIGVWTRKFQTAGAISEFRRADRLRSFAARERVLALYKRADPGLRPAVHRALDRAKEFIGIVGRTHQSTLGSYHGDDGQRHAGWVQELLRTRVRSGDVKDRPRITIVLPDAFGPAETPYRAELRELHGEDNISHHWTRETADEVLNMREELGLGGTLELRFVLHGPPFWMIITENEAFVEHYLAAQKGGTSFVCHVAFPDAGSPAEGVMYEAYKQAFERLINGSVEAPEVYRRYVGRKDPEGRGEGAYMGRRRRLLQALPPSGCTAGAGASDEVAPPPDPHRAGGIR